MHLKELNIIEIQHDVFIKKKIKIIMQQKYFQNKSDIKYNTHFFNCNKLINKLTKYKMQKIKNKFNIRIQKSKTKK